MPITTEFDRQLKLRGLSYDPGDGEIRDCGKRLTWQQVLRLVPGMTLGELALWEDHQQHRFAPRRVK